MRVCLAVIGLAGAANVTTESTRRFCEPQLWKKKTLLQRASPVETHVLNKMETEAPGIPYDGYFEIGCYVDNTPEAILKKAPKGQKVSPKQCFNFCRDLPQIRFFGLTEGRVCYCSPYPTITGGDGNDKCDTHCEGDPNTMCGSMKKSNIFEMHRCGDVTEGAEKDRDAAQALLNKWTLQIGRWQNVVSALTETADRIDVTAIRKRVNGLAGEFNLKIKAAQKDMDNLNRVMGPMNSTLAAYSASSATADMMRGVEDAQENVLAFSAAVEDSTDVLQAYWDEHSLDATMAFRNVDSKALGSADSLSHLSSDVNFMTKKVMESVGCDSDPRDGCSAFPDKLTYFVTGKQLLALFQVYDPAAPKEGRPALSSAADWKKWAIKECHQTCMVTPQCVAGNVIGSTTGSMYAFTCNLKSSVTRVEMSKKGNAGALMSGFVFNQYFNRNTKDISFNVASMQN
mmetsp:Transcript_74106/g.197582  ORF Transcript_74106/g.197582 Transcript_74106/m.197582 type:complete len:456 (-) Transcript_74106:141-1508(-)